MVLQLRQYCSQRLDSMSHVLWASTPWLVRTQNIPSPMWELRIIISASSFPKVLYLASVVYMHMHWSLFSQDLTEKASADFQRVNQSFSFSLLCTTIFLPSALSYKYIYFSALVFLKPAVCLFNLGRLLGSAWAPPLSRQRVGDIHWALLIHCFSVREHWTACWLMPEYICFIYFVWFSNC